MTDFINFLNNKNIAIVGNANSIFNKPRDIDKHEVIIRLNLGSPKGKEHYIGKRTDVLALSMDLKRNEVTKKFNNPKFIFYCTPNNREYISYPDVCVTPQRTRFIPVDILMLSVVFLGLSFWMTWRERSTNDNK